MCCFTLDKWVDIKNFSNDYSHLFNEMLSLGHTQTIYKSCALWNGYLVQVHLYLGFTRLIVWFLTPRLAIYQIYSERNTLHKLIFITSTSLEIRQLCI